MKNKLIITICVILLISLIGCSESDTTTLDASVESIEDIFDTLAEELNTNESMIDTEKETELASEEASVAESEDLNHCAVLTETEDASASVETDEQVTVELESINTTEQTVSVVEADEQLPVIADAETSAIETSVVTELTDVLIETEQEIKVVEAETDSNKDDQEQVSGSEPVEQSVPNVEDAVVYTKKVLEFTWANGYGDETDDYEPHSIVLPKIIRESGVVESINKKMLDDNSEKISMLENNKEENRVFNIDYECFSDDRTLIVVVHAVTGHQASYKKDEYFVYYYDYVNDVALSLDDYLQIKGSKKANYLDAISERVGMGYEASEADVGALVLTEDESFVIYRSPFGWDKMNI